MALLSPLPAVRAILSLFARSNSIPKCDFTLAIKGFKSKAGKEFEAVLKLNKAEKKVEFEFDKK